MASSGSETVGQRHAFGTFGGVFTPSILTIFGLIMFMRANVVLGRAGLWRALLIVSLCCAITFVTGLSIAAISTNTPVKGGGAYFLISRVLGPGFGTAIGIALFLAQALSVPFYILGFVEALTDTFTVLAPWQPLLALGVLVVLFALAWTGAGWVIKVQYGILAVLICAIAAFLIGAWLHFDPAHFRANLASHYEPGQDLWTFFALYFPAVTGIMAGVNMSGDLRDPARSIPLGTLLAIGVSYVVYVLQMLVCNGLAPQEELVARPYLLLVENAVLGLGWLVAAGVFCATISSAIGSNLGAPRVLQAVGRDRVLPLLTLFGRGSRKGDEPRRALLVTFALGGLTLLATMGRDSRQGLNLVAAVVSMVFLYTYGMTNLAAFVESIGGNPSFRPRFRFFHWTTALAGGVACVWSAFMINTPAAMLALLFILGLFYIMRSRELSTAYGDAQRGFVYSRVSNNLVKLARLPADPRNWRPTILVLSGHPGRRLALVEYARWLGQRSGIVSLVNILEGAFDQMQQARLDAERSLRRFVDQHELIVFPEVVVLEDFDRDLAVYLQAYSIGPIKPNIVLLGWRQASAGCAPYYRHLRTIQKLGKAVLVLIDHGIPLGTGARRIDCWWRGHRNGSLMVIIAHLLMLNPEWGRTRLRLLRRVGPGEDAAAARAELQALIGAGRLDAEGLVFESAAPFGDVLRDYSRDASLVLMGFKPPDESGQQTFHEQVEQWVRDMPTILLVYSSGDADLTA